jgi:hypothetical protein
MFLRRFCLVVRCFFTKLGWAPLRVHVHTQAQTMVGMTRLLALRFPGGRVWMCTSSDERSLVREAEATYDYQAAAVVAFRMCF